MKIMGFHIPDNDGTKESIACGMLGGIYSTLANIYLPTDFWSKLWEAALTAAICGAAGWVGKLVVQTAYRSLKTYFVNRKKPKK
ncbi:MAG: hypothetical protein ACTHMC_12385 [Pseudobacter sp.]|uniref:hypothetical protein n=1 Tax=Pseudobacter sp. TaxID=2045420 RepID=UPI003F7DC053